MMRLLETAKTYISARRNKGTLNPEDEMDVHGKVVVITGSNSGIGKATAFEMAKRGAIIVMACRDMEKAEKVMEDIKDKYPEARLDLVHLDLGNLASVRKCAEEIKKLHTKIDILINNAGILYTDGVIRHTTDGFEVHMGVNHLGPFLFTMLLLELLKTSASAASPARIVFTSSTLYMLAELNLSDLMLQKRGSFGFKHWGPYNNSKLANLYFALELGKRLAGTGVNTYAMCPGYVKTDVFRNETGLGAWFSQVGLNFTGITPEQGCETILYCALSKHLAVESGKMYHFNHRWDKATVELEAADLGPELWSMSGELVRLESSSI